MGPVLTSLVDIGYNTKGRAMIFATTSGPRIHVGGLAYAKLMSIWYGADRPTLFVAVERLNSWIVSVANTPPGQTMDADIGQPDPAQGELEQYGIIGDFDLKAPKE